MKRLKYNRYRIWDRSGSGKGKWHYFIGNFGDEKYAMENAKNHIIENLETWAQWQAESYSLEIELDVIPPIKFIEKKIKSVSNKIENLEQHRRDLQIDLDFFKYGPGPF